MRRLAPAALCLLGVLGCAGPVGSRPAPAAEEVASRPRPPGLEVAGVLLPDGVVVVGEARFDLTVAERAAALGRVLAARTGAVVLEARRGVPLDHVERLLAVLAAAGIEDYRLDLGR